MEINIKDRQIKTQLIFISYDLEDHQLLAHFLFKVFYYLSIKLKQ